MISLTGLNAGYGSRLVLKDVSLSFGVELLTVVVGANGSGKSTLLNAIFGRTDYFEFPEPNSGKVLRSTVVRSDMSRAVYVPQYSNVFQDLTIEENIKLASRSLDCQRFFRDKICPEFPFLLSGLKAPVSLLSGGQKQVLALALGVVQEPEIMFVDEPLAGLDPKAIREVKNLIKILIEELAVPLVVIEHRFMLLADIMDRVVGLRAGQLVLDIDVLQLDEAEIIAQVESVFF